MGSAMEHDHGDDKHAAAERLWRQASGVVFITVALAVLMVTFFFAV